MLLMASMNIYSVDGADSNTTENYQPHDHNTGFDWPEIQLSETSKFTLLMIGVLCLWTVTFWLLNRWFNKLDNPQNSFLGSVEPPACLLGSSTEQDSPV